MPGRSAAFSPRFCVSMFCTISSPALQAAQEDQEELTPGEGSSQSPGEQGDPFCICFWEPEPFADRQLRTAQAPAMALPWERKGQDEAGRTSALLTLRAVCPEQIYARDVFSLAGFVSPLRLSSQHRSPLEQAVSAQGRESTVSKAGSLVLFPNRHMQNSRGVQGGQGSISSHPNT